MADNEDKPEEAKPAADAKEEAPPAAKVKVADHTVEKETPPLMDTIYDAVLIIFIFGCFFGTIVYYITSGEIPSPPLPPPPFPPPETPLESPPPAPEPTAPFPPPSIPDDVELPEQFQYVLIIDLSPTPACEMNIVFL
ncbi:hypothetical protein CYMTET_16894 [Cymbomonas tetramitiformis]|uniref:Uncharacterized protein n=1 Tax=Cymbomonas tetramitiformis TaxID=36881 RepID=A0AAE0L7T6_9CHLO|nr:hypothetical protein CYMTET_16894 [Cymbomonas tetramitiformis]